MVIIPLSPVPSQQVQVVLDDQNCTIQVLTRGERMFLNLACNGQDVQNGAIIENMVPVIQIPNAIFAGTLAMVDTQGDSAPEYSGLGDRWFLCYWSAGDEDAPGNGNPEGID